MHVKSHLRKVRGSSRKVRVAAHSRKKVSKRSHKKSHKKSHRKKSHRKRSGRKH